MDRRRVRRSELGHLKGDVSELVTRLGNMAQERDALVRHLELVKTMAERSRGELVDQNARRDRAQRQAVK
jgi:hypothetical protein